MSMKIRISELRKAINSVITEMYDEDALETLREPKTTKDLPQFDMSGEEDGVETIWAGWDDEDLDSGSEHSCPGCGSEPGDGVSASCDHPDGCGELKKMSQVGSDDAPMTMRSRV